MDLNTLIDKIFLNPPKPPKTYNIQLPPDYNGGLFKVLLHILISGTKLIYGNDIDPNNLTLSHFNTLNDYMSSLGFTLKYKYIYENNIPILLNIWFEPLY